MMEKTFKQISFVNVSAVVPGASTVRVVVTLVKEVIMKEWKR